MVLGESDFEDAGFVSESELSATGGVTFRSDAIVDIVSGTVTTSGTPPLINYDDPIQAGDTVVVSGNAAAGTYTVATADLNSFTVVEAIVDAVGGTGAFRHPPGARIVGFDPTGLTHVTGNTLEDVIGELDVAVVDSSEHPALRQLIHLAGGGPFEGFASGAYLETLPAASPFPTSAIWWTDSGKTQKIVENTVVYNANKTVATDTWIAYDTDGTTVLATVVDTITYSGVFETSRTRAIS